MSEPSTFRNSAPPSHERAALLLSSHNARGGFSVDPGVTSVFIGSNSDDHAVEGSFRVTGDALELKSSERSFFSAVT